MCGGVRAVCACACVFNSLRESIWVFLCCQIWWFGGNFSSLGFKAFLLGAPGPRRQGMKHSAFIFNDINLSTGTISGCWLRFDSMFPCFHLRDTCTRFFFFSFSSPAPLPYPSPSSRICTLIITNNFLTVQFKLHRAHLLTYLLAAKWSCDAEERDGGVLTGCIQTLRKQNKRWRVETRVAGNLNDSCTEE